MVKKEPKTIKGMERKLIGGKGNTKTEAEKRIESMDKSAKAAASTKKKK